MHQLNVYSSDMNPLDYTASTIKGHGGHDDNLTKAYAKLIRTRLEVKCEAEEPLWPFAPDEVTEKLNIGLIKELYNDYPLFFKKIIHSNQGTGCKMTVVFLEDNSSLLAFVSAVRESNFL